jgi:hypothetical protein
MRDELKQYRQRECERFDTVLCVHTLQLVRTLRLRLPVIHVTETHDPTV